MEERAPLVDQAPPVAAGEELLGQGRHARKGRLVAVLRQDLKGETTQTREHIISFIQSEGNVNTGC